MRLVLGLALAAAAMVPATASATETCTPYVGDARVCTTLVDCYRYCSPSGEPNVDPQCTPTQPLSGLCETINDVFVELGPK
ncbi:MAG TPA: hypothetical protein VNQ77_19500 [Frankiaceae bacterium]|nr:hypothetical protein [Frankiaceae bacterium]